MSSGTSRIADATKLIANRNPPRPMGAKPRTNRSGLSGLPWGRTILTNPTRGTLTVADIGTTAPGRANTALPGGPLLDSLLGHRPPAPAQPRAVRTLAEA